MTTWLSRHLADYLASLIARRGCGEAEPLRVSSQCKACGGQLVVSASEGTKIFCEKCKLDFDSCPVCAGKERFLGGKIMQCEYCLFRLQLDLAPLPEVTLDLLCDSAALDIDSPRLRRYKVGIESGGQLGGMGELRLAAEKIGGDIQSDQT